MHLAGEAASGRLTPDIREIARDYYDAVYRFCARRVGPDRAADVAQETFLTAQRVLGKFRGESSLRTWMLGIALNECRRALRKHCPECSVLDYALEIKSSEGGEESIVNRQVLRNALEELSEEHRDVVLLHEMEGLTYEEVAGILGIPVGTVKSRLHHAFLNLRRAMSPAPGGA